MLGFFREDVVKEVKRKDVKLNFSFGSLTLKTKGTIEFKSADKSTRQVSTLDNDRIPYSSEFDAATNAK
jgi:hypothetical protein